MKEQRRVLLSMAAALVLFATCDSSDPQPSSPDARSSVSGTVVYASTGVPAEGVEVTMERCTGGTMMHEDWEHDRHMLTDEHGRFHFEYMHDAAHRYRLRTHGMDPGDMCYLDGTVDQNVTLRIQAP